MQGYLAQHIVLSTSKQQEIIVVCIEHDRVFFDFISQPWISFPSLHLHFPTFSFVSQSRISLSKTIFSFPTNISTSYSLTFTSNLSVDFLTLNFTSPHWISPPNFHFHLPTPNITPILDFHSNNSWVMFSDVNQVHGKRSR